MPRDMALRRRRVRAVADHLNRQVARGLAADRYVGAFDRAPRIASHKNRAFGNWRAVRSGRRWRRFAPAGGQRASSLTHFPSRARRPSRCRAACDRPSRIGLLPWTPGMQMVALTYGMLCLAHRPIDGDRHGVDVGDWGRCRGRSWVLVLVSVSVSVSESALASVSEPEPELESVSESDSESDSDSAKA